MEEAQDDTQPWWSEGEALPGGEESGDSRTYSDIISKFKVCVAHLCALHVRRLLPSCAVSCVMCSGGRRRRGRGEGGPMPGGYYCAEACGPPPPLGMVSIKAVLARASWEARCRPAALPCTAQNNTGAHPAAPAQEATRLGDDEAAKAPKRKAVAPALADTLAALDVEVGVGAGLGSFTKARAVRGTLGGSTVD